MFEKHAHDNRVLRRSVSGGRMDNYLHVVGGGGTKLRRNRNIIGDSW